MMHGNRIANVFSAISTPAFIACNSKHAQNFPIATTVCHGPADVVRTQASLPQ